MTLVLVTLCLAAAPSVQLLASIGEGNPQPGNVYARLGQRVTLHLKASAKPSAVHWFKVEPTVGAIDNTTPSFHFEPVTYAENEIDVCLDRLECEADLTPTVLPQVMAGVGTMAFRVRAVIDGVEAATPGSEDLKWGGLTTRVQRVTIRKDDTLLGFATELFNTPYIFGSAGPDGRNQSDLLIGSDCADLIIYARRRMGRRATYTSSYELERQAPVLKRGPPRPGDIVHFPGTRHVGLLYEDRDPIGVVDENDLILHTCWASPTIQPIKETRCSSEPIRVLRFPD